MIKIISGKYKGRVIPTKQGADYRPSTGKFREALFSILTSGEFAEKSLLENSRVLDLFSGTGSLAFEALSRGASFATLVDTNDTYLKSAKLFAEKIGCSDNVALIKASATNLPYAREKYNLVLMDPPFMKDLASKAIDSLIEERWAENGAIIALEVQRNEKLTLHKNLSLLLERNYGNSKLYLMEYVEG